MTRIQSQKKITFILFFSMFFSFLTNQASAEPSNISFTVTGATGDNSGKSIYANFSLSYFASSISDVANITIVPKSAPAGTDPNSLFGPRAYTATPISNNSIVNLSSGGITPAISFAGSTPGTYTYTAVVTFANFANKTIANDFAFVITSATPTYSISNLRADKTQVLGLSSIEIEFDLATTNLIEWSNNPLRVTTTINNDFEDCPSTSSTQLISGNIQNGRYRSVLNYCNEMPSGTYQLYIFRKGVFYHPGPSISYSRTTTTPTPSPSPTPSPTPTPTPTPTNSQTCVAQDSSEAQEEIKKIRNILLPLIKSSPKFQKEVSVLISKVDAALVAVKKDICLPSYDKNAADLAALTATQNNAALLRTLINETTNLIVKIQGSTPGGTDIDEEVDITDDGEIEEPFAEISYAKLNSNRYSIKVNSNLESETLVIRATKKGSSTIKFTRSTRADGNLSFVTNRNLSGYTLTIFFESLKLNSFKR